MTLNQSQLIVDFIRDRIDDGEIVDYDTDLTIEEKTAIDIRLAELENKNTTYLMDNPMVETTPYDEEINELYDWKKLRAPTALFA